MKYTHHPDFRRYSRAEFETRLGDAIVAEQERIGKMLSKNSRLMIEERVTRSMEQEREEALSE